MKIIAYLRSTYGFIVFLLLVCIASSIYFEFIPFFREFNFDAVRMIQKMAKHPTAWINWGRVIMLSFVLLGALLGAYEWERYAVPRSWLAVVVTLILGFPEGLIVYLFLYEKRKERQHQSA